MKKSNFALALGGVEVIEPTIFEDERGLFFESYNARRFAELVGDEIQFLQDNHSVSNKGVLRGLHYQLGNSQGKLVRVVAGSIFDVAVDIRKGSEDFGKWFGVQLSAKNRRQLWIPSGFAHGFYVTEGPAEVLYKATNFYAPDQERSIIWNDPQLAIEWPIEGNEPVLSGKDLEAPELAQAELPELI